MEFFIDGIKLSIRLKDEVLKVHTLEQDLEYSTEITDTKVLRANSTLPYYALKARINPVNKNDILVKKDVVLKTLSNILENNNKDLLSVVFSNKASSVFVTFEVEHEGRPVSIILHCNAPPKSEEVRVKIVQIRHKALEHRNNVRYAAKAKEDYAKIKEDYETVKSEYAKYVEECIHTIPELVI
jgi:hypothetical protein